MQPQGYVIIDLERSLSMERPTCGTCVYWDRDETMDRDSDSDAPEDNSDQCFCYRFPPSNSPEHIVPLDRWQREHHDGATHYIRSVDVQPLTRRTHWCGEHPAFKEYVASLTPLDSPGKPTEPDTILCRPDMIEAARAIIDADRATRPDSPG